MATASLHTRGLQNRGSRKRIRVPKLFSGLYSEKSRFFGVDRDLEIGDTQAKMRGLGNRRHASENARSSKSFELSGYATNNQFQRLVHVNVVEFFIQDVWCSFKHVRQIVFRHGVENTGS